MSQERKQKMPKKIMIYAMVISLICVAGISYAFFTAGLSSETSTTVRADAGTMKITYDGGKNISLDGIYPRDEVWATKNITVTGNNTTDAEMYYKLTLVVDLNTFKTSDPLQYELVSTNTSTNGEVIPSVNKTDITGLSIDLNKGYFAKASNAKHTYLLKIYYPKKTISQNANQGAEFSAHVEIESTKAPKINGVLSELVLYNNEVKVPVTTPGTTVSIASEALLSSTEDNYGTSYYFRGNVKNNYVEFANKCWRIVRINGDGTVKLILHNDNTTGVASPCSSANNDISAAFARYSGTTYKSAFNTNERDNAYVGFMYGTVGASDYASTHANTNKSTILTNLETWYSNNLVLFEDKISDTVWCNDKTNITDTTYAPLVSFPTGLGYARNVTYYGATKRLVSASGSAGGTGPSLKCNKGLSEITTKIGLITADELAFAGYAFAQNNTTTYLQENATDVLWSSMSPVDFAGLRARVWYVAGSSGFFYVNGGVGSSLGVRPSISLKASVTVTGVGTSENPYKVV
ncbi:MAG: hypothetical protein Q4C33_01515 [bacterium]|nr:hypothetical protein [bacterium]